MDTQKLLYETQQVILESGKDTDTVLDILSDTALKLTGNKGFAVILFDDSTNISRIRYNTDFEVSSLETHCQVFAASRMGRLPVTSEMVATVEGDFRFVLPIGEPEEPFGAIIMPAEPGRHVQGVDDFRQIASNAITTFMEVELVKLKMAELNTLLEVGKVISSTLNLSDLLRKIMSMATKVMRCETSTVYLVDNQTNELYFHIVQGDPNVGAKLQEIRLPMGTGLSGWCARENKSVIVPDTSKDPRFFKTADKKSGFVTRSMICVPMRLKDEVVGVIQVLNRTGDIPFNDHDVEILEAVGNQAVSAIDNARLYQNIQKVYISTIEVLATAIDAKDPYTQGHSRRVTQYSVAIAEELGLPEKEIENIRYAGLLHDVGKIGIKDSIIKKPGRLTDEEYATIKKHPSIGAKILKPVEFLADKIPGVLHHHEYYDGRGYPEHLTGENIPLMGRIICVADAFDAMTTSRPYRKGLSVQTAVAELNKFSGKQFDPVCVEAFLKAFDKKLYRHFQKVDDSGDMVLLNDDVEIKETSDAIHGEPLESQPYPPMLAFGAEKLESQPYPPINAQEIAPQTKPSSQPFPPVNCDKDSQKP